jgi:hypothetical protein
VGIFGGSGGLRTNHSGHASYAADKMTARCLSRGVRTRNRERGAERRLMWASSPERSPAPNQLLGHGDEMVIHAMPARKKYLDLLP